MKMKYHALLFGLFSFAVAVDGAARRPAPVATNSYSANVSTVHDAQAQALEQARQMLAQGEGVRDRGALESAIKEMERARDRAGRGEKIPGKSARRHRRRAGRVSGIAESHAARISRHAVTERPARRAVPPARPVSANSTSWTCSARKTVTKPKARPPRRKTRSSASSRKRRTG